MMKGLIKKYIEEEVSKLRYKGDYVDLSNVYPFIIEEVLGKFCNPYDLNGYNCDYWVVTDKYYIEGCMRYGTARIELIKGEEKPMIGDNYESSNKNVNIDEFKIPDEAKDWQTFYFTFGYGQVNFGYYQPIKAESRHKAHEKMFELYGTKWSFMYTDKDWQSIDDYSKGKPLKLVYAL